jgi:biotin carboxyl carrier protein
MNDATRAGAAPATAGSAPRSAAGHAAGAAPAAAPVLEAEDLHKRFHEGSGAGAIDVRVLRGQSLTVHAGQTLAVVEKAKEARTYPVTAPIQGVVLARHTNAGDVAGDEPLFEIADLSVL